MAEMNPSPHRICETTGDPELWCEHCDTAQHLKADDQILRTVAQLRRIPDLAALVEQAEGRPVRQATGRSRRTKAASTPLPATTSVRDMLTTALAELSEAVRVVAEEQRATTDTWPDLADPPTIATECGYLAAAADIWADDDFCRRWVAGTARKIHEALSRWTGEQAPTPPRYTCPHCQGRLHRDSYAADGDGQQLACSGCGHIWHPKDIAHQAMLRTPLPLPDLAAQLGLTARTLQRWAAANLIRPTTTHTPSPKHPALYLPADAHRIATMGRRSRRVRECEQSRPALSSACRQSV